MVDLVLVACKYTRQPWNVSWVIGIAGMDESQDRAIVPYYTSLCRTSMIFPHFQIPPEVWCFRYAFGVQVPSLEVLDV